MGNISSSEEEKVPNKLMENIFLDDNGNLVYGGDVNHSAIKGIDEYTEASYVDYLGNKINYEATPITVQMPPKVINRETIHIIEPIYTSIIVPSETFNLDNTTLDSVHLTASIDGHADDADDLHLLTTVVTPLLSKPKKRLSFDPLCMYCDETGHIRLGDAPRSELKAYVDDVTNVLVFIFS